MIKIPGVIQLIASSNIEITIKAPPNTSNHPQLNSKSRNRIPSSAEMQKMITEDQKILFDILFTF
jgi:hypothetical protein